MILKIAHCRGHLSAKLTGGASLLNGQTISMNRIDVFKQLINLSIQFNGMIYLCSVGVSNIYIIRELCNDNFADIPPAVSVGF
jgi:hypothetical protein